MSTSLIPFYSTTYAGHRFEMVREVNRIAFRVDGVACAERAFDTDLDQARRWDAAIAMQVMA